MKATIPLTAEQQIITLRHIGLVRVVVKKFYKKTVHRIPLEDAMGAGMVGLCKAVRGYQPDRVNQRTGKPNKFSTYAARIICNAIRDAARHGGAISLGRWNGTEACRARLACAWRASTLEVAERDVDDPECHSGHQRLGVDSLETVLATLDPREAELLRWMYYDGLTLKQAALRLGIARREARLIRDSALAWLKLVACAGGMI